MRSRSPPSPLPRVRRSHRDGCSTVTATGRRLLGGVVAGCRGFSGPCPSAPLDELASAYGARLTSCTPVPPSETVSGGGAGDVGGEATQEVHDAVGAVDDEVGALDERVLLVGAGADEEADHAPATEVRHGVERLDVPQVVTDEHH